MIISEEDISETIAMQLSLLNEIIDSYISVAHLTKKIVPKSELSSLKKSLWNLEQFKVWVNAQIKSDLDTQTAFGIISMSTALALSSMNIGSVISSVADINLKSPELKRLEVLRGIMAHARNYRQQEPAATTGEIVLKHAKAYRDNGRPRPKSASDFASRIIVEVQRDIFNLELPHQGNDAVRKKLTAFWKTWPKPG